MLLLLFGLFLNDDGSKSDFGAITARYLLYPTVPAVSLYFHTSARYFHLLILQNICQKVTVCNKDSHQNVHTAKNFYISVLFSPEDRRTQVENSSKTEKITAG